MRFFVFNIMTEDKKSLVLCCDSICKNKETEKHWNVISNIKWEIHHWHGQSYLTPQEYSKQLESLSELRRLKGISLDNRLCLFNLFKIGLKHYYELQEILRNQPRRDAQSFIGKKEVRELVFKIHGKKCLCCGSLDNISLDHITPIFHGGKNNLDNLQPLCRSCNSRKGTNIIDYR